MLTVSHDRYFLDKVADRVVEVRNGRFVPFEGNFSEYWSARAQAAPPGRGRVSTRRPGRERLPATATSPNGKQNDLLAAKIEEAEREREALEKRVAAAFTTGDHHEGQRASHLLEEQRRRVEELYGRWIGDSQ